MARLRCREQPWSYGQFQQKPKGLRETVLRVAYMNPGEVVSYTCRWKPSLLKQVALWRQRTPAKFRELMRLMQIDLVPNPRGPQPTEIV